MARGSAAKEDITKRLLNTFEGSFLYNGGKEIRIPMMENGELLQIKVALTCAKTNVENENEIDNPFVESAGSSSMETSAAPSAFMDEPSAQEKAKVEELCKALGILKA